MIGGLRLPDPPGRRMLLAAALTWVAVALGRSGLWPVALAGGLLAFLMVRLRGGRSYLTAALLTILMTAGAVSGAAASARERSMLSAWVPDGPIRVAGQALTDTQPGRYQSWFLLRPTFLWRHGEWTSWTGPNLQVSVSDDVAAGDQVVAKGTARKQPGFIRGGPYAGRVDAHEVKSAGETSPLFRVANLARRRITDGLAAYGSPPAALLAGFLIGDIRDLPAADREAMRLAGLSHFVAVSGSNVALFLGLWWLVAGPVAVGSVRRAVVGISGLILFVVITRWEPSVVRAAVMAGFVLAGRAVGIPLTSWSALGAAVTSVLLVSGELVENVGFQLSVAATLGVLVGARVFEGRPRWLKGALGMTLGAQLAVAPLLLWHFGGVPLVAPLANVVAAPLVALATSVGGLGLLIGLAPVTTIAVGVADVVLRIAWVAAPYPQLGPLGLGAALVVLLTLRWRVPRLIATSAAAPVILLAAVMPGPGVDRPAAVFLDVGQGDAALLLGSGGEVILFDGGPDPGLLAAKLRDLDISHIDLLIISHPHEDHIAGLEGIIERVDVDAVWHPGYSPMGERLTEIVAAARDLGASSDIPMPGTSFRVGSIDLEIVGPLRRYASPNDQSLVVRAEVGGARLLFSGDVERIAQRELGTVPAEVLKVPHQGAATSDPEWLAAVGAGLAVISVGPNTYGHPSPDIVDALRRSGATVVRTDQAGDIVVRLPG